MFTFIMHTRYTQVAVGAPESQEELERIAAEHIRSEFPQLEWISVKVIGPHDYLDIFRAPDMNTAFRIAKLLHALTSAHTEVWADVEQGEPIYVMRVLPSGEK